MSTELTPANEKMICVKENNMKIIGPLSQPDSTRIVPEKSLYLHPYMLNRVDILPKYIAPVNYQDLQIVDRGLRRTEDKQQRRIICL